MAQQKQQSQKNGIDAKWVFLVFAILIIICGIGYFVYTSSFTLNQKEVKITPTFIEAVHQYDELYPFSEGFAAVKKDGKFGFINTQGELVIPAKFYGVSKFSEGLACVYGEQRNRILFINTSGDIQFVTPYRISSYYFHTQQIDFGIYLTDEDVAGIYFNGGKCKIVIGDAEDGYTSKYIDKEGKEIDIMEEAQVSDSSSSPNDFCIFQDDNTYKYGVKDKNGNILIEPQYDYISNFYQGVAVAKICESSPIKFENHGDYLDALDRGEKLQETVYGYIDAKGNNTFNELDYKKLADYKEQQIVKNAKLEQARRQTEQEKGPEWIDGIWVFEGKIPNLMGGYMNVYSRIRIDRNSQTISSNNDFCNGRYEVYGGEIHCGDNYIAIDYNNQRLEFGDGAYFRKVSDSSGGLTDNHSAYNERSTPSARVSFSNPTDVMVYLDGKTFQSSGTIRTTIRVRHEAIYINGTAFTAAPRITNITPTTATIVVYSPYNGGGDIKFYLNATDNIISQGGDLYYLK